MPGGEFLYIDRSFRSCVNPNARLDKLYTGCRWAEGPVWFPAQQSLIWSDIPNNRMLRLVEAGNHIGEFRAPSGYSNGNTIDRQGRLVTCEHGNRRVTCTQHDGSIIILADQFQGGRLNSPNDVVVSSDGAVWFTDPTYGIDSDYEGYRSRSEQGASRLYRIAPGTGRVEVAADDFVQPNGLAFSPDERHLYVADTGATHVADGPRHIRVFTVGSEGKLHGGDVFAVCDSGLFDGFRLDADGRLWTSAGDGVHCFNADGAMLGKIAVPEVVANVAFGGPRLNRLFICGTTSLYAITLGVCGHRLV